MAGFITDDQLSQRLDSYLRPEPDEVRAAWWSPQSVTDASQWALSEILSHLGARGFSPTQIANWGRGAEYQMALGLWWLLNQGVIAAPVEGDRPTVLDRRQELDTVVITDAVGTLIRPAGPPLMSVGSGSCIRGDERIRDTRGMSPAPLPPPGPRPRFRPEGRRCRDWGGWYGGW